ncbi:MAG TPA: AraC family transcriptional regulator [Gallionellaceae bacterium]
MNADKYNSLALASGDDAFSQMLHLLKLDVSVYYNAKVCGDWRLTEHYLGATVFHVVMSGSTLLDVPGHFKGVLNSGDLVIFPRELPHTMVSAIPMQGEVLHLDYRAGQDVDGTGLMCGMAQFQHQGSRTLLDALPPVFVIRYHPANYWLKSLLEIFLAENMQGGPASKVIFDRLSELLFVYALRQYVADYPQNAGMLALYGHPRLARAVAAVQARPEQDWTLDAMAREAALSRTAFAETFKGVSGWTPGQYLTWWRMQLAWSLLSGGESTAEVANRVGYKSEAAFSRAFQKIFQTAAGKVRRTHKIAR